MVGASLRRADIEVRLDTAVERIVFSNGRLVCHAIKGQQVETVAADHVFDCSYSALNCLTLASGLPAIPLKHELAEIALIETPPALRDIAVTVIDGLFFPVCRFRCEACIRLPMSDILLIMPGPRVPAKSPSRRGTRRRAPGEHRLSVT